MWRKIVFVLVAGFLLASFVPRVQAQTAETCLVVKNNRSIVATVTVKGYDETDWRWVIQPGESSYLSFGKLPSNPMVRMGQEFTIWLYDGVGINSSRMLPGDNRYISWTYDQTLTHSGDCKDGSWVATLHD